MKIYLKTIKKNFSNIALNEIQNKNLSFQLSPIPIIDIDKIDHGCLGLFCLGTEDALLCTYIHQQVLQKSISLTYLQYDKIL